MATQTTLDFLPEHHTDFIFAVISERNGFLGARCCWCSTRCSSGARCASPPCRATCTAASSPAASRVMFLFQVFVNIGMTIGIMPVTGIPLPFISYGGTAMIAFLMLVGLLQAIHLRATVTPSTGGGLASSVSISQDRQGRHRGARRRAEAPRLCVVGAGDASSRAWSARSRPAPPTSAGGVSAALDASRRPTSRATQRLAARWDIVVLVARRAAAPADVGAGRARGARAPAAACIGARRRRRTTRGWAREAGFFDDEVARGLGARSGRQADAREPHRRTPPATAPAALAASPAGRAPRVLRPCRARQRRQNGVIGVVVIIPGADMPAMTANQIRMVLKIAAAYGEEIGLDRAVEILSVVGTGFVLRTLARQALDFVPGFGWAAQGRRRVLGHGRARAGRHRVLRGRGAAPRSRAMQRINSQLEQARPGSPDSQRRLASG